MSRSVLLAQPAFDDLRRNTRWWAEHRSLGQAERWYDGFLARLDSLEKDAERCALARENAEFPFEVRELLFGIGSRPTHRALFMIRPDTVVVLAIRYVAQDAVTPDDL